MESKQVNVDTSTRQVVDLTREVRAFCEGKGDGLLSVFVPHSTAGVAIIEMGSGSDADLVAAMQRLLPRDDSYYGHSHGSRGHGADHLLPAIVGPSIVVPVVNAELALGVWQSIVVVDLNPDNPRRSVRLSFAAG